MSSKPFKANQWLVTSKKQMRSSSALQEDFSPQKSEEGDLSPDSLSFHSPQKKSQKVIYQGVEQSFTPSNFLIPGWTGEGLFSKPAIDLKKLQEILLEDAKALYSKHQWNNSLKRAIFNEFKNYLLDMGSKGKELVNGELGQFNRFWSEIKNPSPQNQALFDEFQHIFCFRAVTIYLFKIRFISLLSKELDLCPTSNCLLNPNAFLGRIFQKGSSTELYAESLQTNHYSWFRPSPQKSDQIIRLVERLGEVSITELMKLFSSDVSLKNNRKSLDLKDSEYSHSLSHKAFGLFLNSLLVDFPKWVEGRQLHSSVRQRLVSPKVLNTHFEGDNLTALTLSHWLAQEQNVSTPWTEILCPEFVSEKFKNGHFLKLCHELQYLAFLVKVSQQQNYKPIQLICSVMRDKYSNQGADEFGQMSMFSTPRYHDELKHQRSVLNMVKVPKQNSHHYLVQKIMGQSQLLSPDAYLYVFSNQKLFVPSQTERIQQLLKTYRIEGNFSFEGLKGKGEIPNHLYILRKRRYAGPNPLKTSHHYGQAVKESTLTFRLHGSLNIFHKFNLIYSTFHNFMNSRAASTPIYQKELDEGLSLEFHQDAIVQGKLLSASSQGSNQVLHPSFFSKLTKTCVSLESFFQIEGLSQAKEKQSSQLPTGLLGIHIPEERNYPLILILDCRDQENYKIEIISSESYQAKREQYGHAFYHYFGLIPKIPELNINLFREFFENDIGSQIIQLCLNNDGPSNIKSKVRSLLVPQFLGKREGLPASTEKSLAFLEKSKDEILSSHPEELTAQVQHLQETLTPLAKTSPWQLLTRLTYLKSELSEAHQEVSEAGKTGEPPGKVAKSFTNKMITNALLELPTSPLFPHNPEVFMEFLAETREQIYEPLIQVQWSTELLDEGDKQDDLECIDLHSANGAVVRCHGRKNLLCFIQFILNSAQGQQISQLLQSLRIPSTQQLEEVLQKYSHIKEGIETLYNATQQQITTTLVQNISLSKK